ncbi:MAG: hypothetical protein ACJ77B_09855 [Chloroflexota bacterium]
MRVTVVPNAIPTRRSSTLSEDAFVSAVEPARGGPADGVSLGTELLPEVLEPAPQTRTIVRSAPLPPAGAGDPLSSRPVRRRPLARRIAAVAERSRAAAPARPFTLPASVIASEWGTTIPPRRPPVGITIESEIDWTLAALRAAAARTAEQAMVEGRVPVAAVARHGPIASLRATSATFRDPRGADVRRSMARSFDGESSGGADTIVATAPGRGVSGGRSTMRRMPSTPIPPSDEPPGRADDACSPLRRIADERCAVATGARARAATAADALAAAQHAYDEHIAAAERAAAAADQRSMRSAKEAAQQMFRDARAAAHSKEAVEAAARDWLTEINRINHSARDGSVQLERERQTAGALVATIERLTVDAETARIAADAADVGCAAARRSVAECERAEDARQRAARNRDADEEPDRLVAAATAVAAPVDADAELPEAPSTVPFGAPDVAPDDDSELEVAMRAKGPEPAIIRLLRGDRGTLDRLIAELSGTDPAARREWQLAIAGMVDAIVGRAIEASILTFPADHPFWGAYTRPQQRDIAAALSSLGFRFDGLGGWTDDRVPSQRDLSLAVGYAGIDPMRTRRWPTEEEAADLFRGVVVAADEYLTGAAGGLTLGEMLSALGRRADALTEIWNEWGRLRPLLLASA